MLDFRFGSVDDLIYRNRTEAKDMAEFHILFGFKEEEIIPKIVAAIRNEGHEVTYTERTTKESIAQYLNKNTSCNYAVLRESWGPESFTASEFAKLTDTRDINIVAITESGHKGTSFMDTLYAAGITSAILVDDRVGASAGKIAELLLNKRTRKAARKYYGLQESEVRVDILTYGEYIMNYSILMNEDLGINIVDRFLGIVKKLSPKQVAQFLTSMPVNVLKELQGYEEFWLVIDTLKENKININGTKPSVLKKGLTDEEFRKALRSDYSFKKKKGIRGPHATVDKKDPEVTEKAAEEIKAEETSVNETKNYFEDEVLKSSSKEEQKTDDDLNSSNSNEEKTVKQEVKQQENAELPAKNKKKKEPKPKKPKTKGKLLYWILIAVLSILLIATWYYLVFVIKI